eukprot:2503110-Ditylum_brightwellii.AAC.1
MKCWCAWEYWMPQNRHNEGETSMHYCNNVSSQRSTPCSGQTIHVSINGRNRRVPSNQEPMLHQGLD